MLATFLERAGSLFDRWFFVSHWGPVFVAWSYAAVICVFIVGRGDVHDALDGLASDEKASVVLLSLVVITVLGFVLQAISPAILSVYRGELPPGLFFLWPLRAWFVRAQQGAYEATTAKAHAEAKEEYQALGRQVAQIAMYLRFPRNRPDVKPTALGNVLRAVEVYPYEMYLMDGYVWSPRLEAVMPAEMRERITAAGAPLLALVNLSALILVVGLVGSAADLYWNPDPWLFGTTFFTGTFGAFALYRVAVSQALLYGDQQRAAVDLYRHLIFLGLNLNMPHDLSEERALWSALTQRTVLGELMNGVDNYSALPFKYKTLQYRSASVTKQS